MGLFGFYVLGKFDLGVFEHFIFYSFCNTYFYISSRKVLGWVYFPYYWVVLMIGFNVTSLVGLIFFSEDCDPFYSLFLFYSEEESSLLFQYFLKIISGLKDNIEGNSYAFCIPPDDNPNTVAKPFWKKFIISHRKELSALNNAFMSGTTVGGFSHMVTGGNRRISIPVAISVGVMQFAVNIVDDSDNM